MDFKALNFSNYEIKVAEILDAKLKKAGLDPADDNLTDEQISEIEDLTKEAQDEAKKALNMI